MKKPGPNDAVQITETHDLEPFRQRMQPIPDGVQGGDRSRRTRRRGIVGCRPERAARRERQRGRHVEGDMDLSGILGVDHDVRNGFSALRVRSTIEADADRYVITVAGESGSGKSETGKAIADELGACGISTVLLGQDDDFVLPPTSNDAKRRADDTRLGPHVEVRLDILEQNLLDTLELRRERNRGKEVGDPFIEDVLLEHQIIAGHRQLADSVITPDDDVIVAP